MHAGAESLIFDTALHITQLAKMSSKVILIFDLAADVFICFQMLPQVDTYHSICVYIVRHNTRTARPSRSELCVGVDISF